MVYLDLDRAGCGSRYKLRTILIYRLEIRGDAAQLAKRLCGILFQGAYHGVLFCLQIPVRTLFLVFFDNFTYTITIRYTKHGIPKG